MLTETVAVPEVVDELSGTAAPVTEHVGISVAPAGDDVTAHDTVTVPAYPFVAVTVTVELADAPGLMDAGEAAAGDTVYDDCAACVTVTCVVPDIAP